MPDSMIERVARAIYESYHGCEARRPEFDGISWETVCESVGTNRAAALIHKMAMTEARAAILAMIGPSARMIAAAQTTRGDDLEPTDIELAGFYNAMIHEASKDSP